MSTTTVRLDGDDERALDLLATHHGGRSGAIRHAIRQAADVQARLDGLAQVLADWETEDGPADTVIVAELRARYFAAPE